MESKLSNLDYQKVDFLRLSIGNISKERKLWNLVPTSAPSVDYKARTSVFPGRYNLGRTFSLKPWIVKARIKNLISHSVIALNGQVLFTQGETNAYHRQSHRRWTSNEIVIYVYLTPFSWRQGDQSSTCYYLDIPTSFVYQFFHKCDCNTPTGFMFRHCDKW